MIYHPLRLLVLMAFIAFSGMTVLTAADNASKSATDVMNGMRLRQLTKDLALTSEQQTKVKGLFDVEAEHIARIDANKKLTIAERTTQVTAAKKETQAKVKALLTPEQAEKYEKLLTPRERKRKA